jgi:hypothetical protein
MGITGHNIWSVDSCDFLPRLIYFYGRLFS